jgi:hypothetical protein
MVPKPCPPRVRIGHHRRQRGSERGLLMRMDEMDQFVSHNIVDDRQGSLDEAPLESDQAVDAENFPPTPLFAPGDPGGAPSDSLHQRVDPPPQKRIRIKPARQGIAYDGRNRGQSRGVKLGSGIRGRAEVV